MIPQSPLPLQAQVQNYAWGKFGADSTVARLYHHKREEIPKEQPYAELWLGAHPKSPAIVEIGGTEVALNQLISEQPLEVLGANICRYFGPELPFLFKILSVRTALSIQAHPTKDHAKKLHQRNPKEYPDENHKPEMAIALGSLELLYGLRSAEELKTWLERTPELALVVKTDQLDPRQALSDLISADQESIEQACQQLYKRLKKNSDLLPEEKWVLRLEQEYPTGDSGIFCFFIMKLLHLEAGEAIYIGPNIPHAYLDGELAECMANSDNVVRAGLTPKFKDNEALLQMIEDSPFEPCLLDAKENTLTKAISSYRPPVSEFAIDVLKGSFNPLSLKTNDSVEIIFCLEGNARIQTENANCELSPGAAFLIPAQIPEYQLSQTEGQIFRVFVPEAE